MDRLVRWYWRHFRQRHFLAMAVVVVVFDYVALLLPVSAFFGVVWRLTVRDTVAFSLLTLVGAVFAAAGGVGTSRKIRLPIRAWIDGDHSHPIETRDAVLVAPERMAFRGGLSCAPWFLTVVAHYISDYAGFSTRGFVAVIVMGMVAMSLAAFLMANGLRLLNGPLLEEIASELPVDVRPALRTWSLFASFGMGTWLASVAAAVTAATAASRYGDTRQNVLITGLAVAMGMSLYGVVLSRFGLLEPTFRPIRDLVSATKRVNAGDYSRSIPVTSTDEFSELVVAFNTMMVGLRQRSALHSAFGSYVDPALAERLLQQDGSEFAGEAVHATVFFADVRGFTNYAETVEPAAAVARLNELFNIVVPAIRAAGGHTNRYIGDGVLAVFGTPERLDNHAQHALAAAVTIQREVRKTFGEDLRLGIGMNSGDMIAGTIGGGGKLDFTVIGDVVNVAARVEELTKETGDCILLTQDTLDLVRATPNIVTNRGMHTMRGREHPVQLYAVHL